MQIQLNTDNIIDGTERLQAHVERIVEKSLGRFDERITRLEVHLNDVNGPKESDDDHRCAIEARLRGLQPITVTHTADTLDQALQGATRKLERVLDSTLGKKLDQQRGR